MSSTAAPANSSGISSPPPREWTVQEIRDLVQIKFGKRPCWYQVKVARSLYAGKDVIGCAPTGAGKTLSFWIPLLMALEDGREMIMIVVTPLNLLGKQNQATLETAGLPAVAVSKENANAETWSDIGKGKYRVVIVNPEILMGSGEVEKLWKTASFTKRILNFIFDEGHCISQWGTFRKEYLNLGQLRYLIPERIPFYVASTTLPLPILLDVVDILKIRLDQAEQILRSNDRPEISLLVRGLTFSAKSFQDLAFLIPEGFRTGDSVKPFLVFFDTKSDAQNACKAMRKRLPREDRHKIKWFHADLTQQQRELLCEQMRAGEIWGLFCTDAFGMGMDLPDIKIVVQWKATCNFCTLWQRFGRAAHGPGHQGTAILLVEKKDTDEERQAKAKKAEKAVLKKAREGIGTGLKRKASTQADHPTKRIVLADRTSSGVNHSSESTVDSNGEPAPQDACASEQPLDTSNILKEQRRIHYSKRVWNESAAEGSSTAKGKGKGKSVVVGSAMDDFINTHVDMECRRVVPMLVFGNDIRAVNDHLFCDDVTPDGCARCRPKVSAICCDLCNPDAFKAFNIPIREKAPKQAAKSSLTPYSMATKDFDLQDALFDWRDANALKKFKPSIVETLSPGLFLSDDIIARVVDCAHFSKLLTIPQLIKETSWREDWATEFGESLLSIVHHHYPPPLPPSLVVVEGSVAVNEDSCTALPRKRAPVKCSACLQLGHIKSNNACPKKIEARRQAHSTSGRTTDENVAPAAPGVDNQCQTRQNATTETVPLVPTHLSNLATAMPHRYLHYHPQYSNQRFPPFPPVYPQYHPPMPGPYPAPS